MQLADIDKLNRMARDEAVEWLRKGRYAKIKDVNGIEMYGLFFVGNKTPMHCVGYDPQDGLWHDYANGLKEDGTLNVRFMLWDLEDFDIENPFTVIKIWPRGEYEYLIGGNVYVCENHKIHDFGDSTAENIEAAYAWIQEERYGDKY